jgi:class 3 adenylate cyclase
MATDVRYASNGDVSLAWTTVGTGPVDVLMLLGGLSHIEHILEEPSLARFYEKIGHFARVILMDRRGVGLSDPVTGTLTLEDECEDMDAVLTAAGADRAVLFAYGWGGPPVVHFAVHHPQRVRAIVLYAAVASGIAALEDFGIERVADQIEDDISETLASWGTGDAIEQVAPSRSDDVRLRAWFGRLARLSQSPGAMRTLWRSTAYYDVRDQIGAIRVPTLILHRTGDRTVDVAHSRDMAERIPGARFVELDGIDNLPSVGDADALIAEIEEFLTGVRRRSVDRALLTVVITDIVDSTGHAARLGDGGWSDLLAAHDSAVRHQIDRYDGREVKTIGDSFLIVFAGAPSLAHRCALAIVPAVRELGLEVRVGIHTGECELIGEDVGGMAVHIASRVAKLAGPGEVCASGTAFGTVVGSGLEFGDFGTHELRGVPGRWPVMRLLR